MIITNSVFQRLRYAGLTNDCIECNRPVFPGADYKFFHRFKNSKDKRFYAQFTTEPQRPQSEPQRYNKFSVVLCGLCGSMVKNRKSFLKI